MTKNQIPEPVVEAESYSFDRLPSGRLQMRLVRFDGGEYIEVARLVLDPADTLEFMAKVAHEGHYSVMDAMTAVHYGDCATCKNVRLIEVPRPGSPRMERVHCPTCSGPGSKGLPPVPQVGGGVA